MSRDAEFRAGQGEHPFVPSGKYYPDNSTCRSCGKSDETPHSVLPVGQRRMDVSELERYTQEVPNRKGEEYVQALAAHIRSGGKVDPLEVVSNKQKTYLADGHHRLAASRLAGLDQVPAKVYRTSPGERMYGKNR